MSGEWMVDPYAAQLRAAKAEGELAAVMDALREFAEENGLNPEIGPRDLLAKAAGAFRSCAAMSDARYTEIQELRAEMEAMRPRLMPEGMEWPCFDDGEPVRIGDEYADTFGANTVATIEFGDGYSAINPNTPGGYVVGKCEGAHGRYVPRPAPKVLDADGAEIRVGDKLYDTETGCGRTVRAINANGTIEFDGHGDRGWFANRFTHERPVLAADGRPLRDGETVYDVEDAKCYPHTVASTELDGLGHVKTTCEEPTPASVSIHPSRLTHEPPDSWERVMADAESIDRDLRGFDGDVSTCADLVRRAKALAGRDA